VHNRIISAVKRVEFVSDRMSYRILRGRCCHIIVLNVHSPTEDTTDEAKDSFYEELERVFDKFPKDHTKIVLGDFTAKVGMEDIFKQTIGNESLHEISNDNGVRGVNFATSRNLRVKSTMFPRRNILKYTLTSPDGKTHNQIDHILVDRRRNSNILDVRSYRAADCDTDHYLVVAKVRERLAVHKQRSHRSHRERFNLKKLNEVEGKEQYCV
jgi:endonuclease/exonuclease/phosphatase family metal-dependent hydrolase